MQAQLPSPTQDRGMIRALAKTLARRDRHDVVSLVTSATDGGPVRCRHEGARRLLVEAAAAVALDGLPEDVVALPSRLFASMDLDLLFDHAYRDGTQDDIVRQHAVAYLRRIGMTADHDPAVEPNLPDQHEIILFPVSDAFGA